MDFTTDQKRKINNAKHFLKYDYNHYLTLSVEANNLRGMKLQQVKVDTSAKIDATEQLYLRIMDAKKIVKSTQEAINHCSDTSQHPYKTALTLSYLDNESVVYVVDHINYGQAYYYKKILPSALLEFADRFLVQQLNNKVNSIIDLNVLEKAS